MSDSKQKSVDEWSALHNRAGELFTPSAPIDAVDLFAGRWAQLTAIKDAVITKGQHAIVFGERGVGKTSLVSVVGPLMSAFKVEVPVVVRLNCGVEDTFGRLWKRAFTEVVFRVKRKRLGFTDEVSTSALSLAEQVTELPTPEEVVSTLRQLPLKFVFVFDEFDQLPTKSASKPFADTIKALSDFAVPSTVIIVGVGDDVGTLLEAHASVERALVQIPVPRMTTDELEEILVKVPSQLGMTFSKAAVKQIVGFSRGLPHYVHLIGLYAARAAIQRRTREVDVDEVNQAAETACSKVPKSTLDAYRTAVDSPQRDALFRYVLLACALTSTDDRGYFAPGDIRTALRVIGRELEIAVYASHLHKFASTDRGDVLQKTGQPRRHRYRFKNPLMQPYVVMRGLADGLITMQQIRGVLTSTESGEASEEPESEIETPAAQQDVAADEPRPSSPGAS